MGFHDCAIEAQQRSAAVSLRVHAPLDGLKSIFGQQRAELSAAGWPSIHALSMLKMPIARLSHVFKTILPTKPSQTTTSTRLLNRS